MGDRLKKLDQVTKSVKTPAKLLVPPSEKKRILGSLPTIQEDELAHEVETIEHLIPKASPMKVHQKPKSLAKA